MSNASLFPIPKPQFFDSNGVVLAGGKVYFYEPGTVTAKNVYSTSNMAYAMTNPVILDSAGRAEIWIDGYYDIILKDANDTQIYSANNVSSQYNQANSDIVDQWLSQSDTPTYIGANQFSVLTDLTSTYSTGRRIKATVTAGTIYGAITASNYANAITTVTNLWDSGSLDSGLSNVALGIITAANTSIPFQIPIGGIIWWHKSLTGAPALPWGWVECNGQTLSDAASPFNGQTIPDINGQSRFIRGSNVSGNTQANQNLEHAHGITSSASWPSYSNGTRTPSFVYGAANLTGGVVYESNGNSSYLGVDNSANTPSVASTAANSGGLEARPINISMVAIMRVK